MYWFICFICTCEYIAQVFNCRSVYVIHAHMAGQVGTLPILHTLSSKVCALPVMGSACAIGCGDDEIHRVRVPHCCLGVWALLSDPRHVQCHSYLTHRVWDCAVLCCELTAEAVIILVKAWVGRQTWHVELVACYRKELSFLADFS